MFSRTISCAALAAFAMCPVWGEEAVAAADTPSPDDASPQLSLVSPPDKLETGIRFIQSRQMVGNSVRTAMMPLSPGIVSVVPLGTGLPAKRVPFPDDKVIRLYDTTEAAECSGMPMLSCPLPEKHGSRMLGVLLPGKDGFNILFVDEADCMPGITLFQNLTKNTYLLHAPAVPKTEKDLALLTPGGHWTFGSSGKSAPSERYPLEIRKKIRDKKGKTQWYMERKMMLRRESYSGLLILFLPDERGGLQMIQEISLYKDVAG